MSTEHIVNRIHTNFDIQAEKAKFDEQAPEQTQPPVYDAVTGITHSREDFGQLSGEHYKTFVEAPAGTDPVLIDEAGELLQQDPEVLKTAWEDLTNSGQTVNGTDLNAQIGTTDALSQLRALVGGDDLKVFRQQVIRALKHIGVDTKKFFGE